MAYEQINELEAIFLGSKDGWYVFEDDGGHLFEFDDVKMDLLRKFNLNDESESGHLFDILYSINTDDEIGYEELVIVGLKRLE